jgi:hypothetical protein
LRLQHMYDLKSCGFFNPFNGRFARIAADRSPEQENLLSSRSGKSARHRSELLRAVRAELGGSARTCFL